jgi:hypothetical protein
MKEYQTQTVIRNIEIKRICNRCGLEISSDKDEAENIQSFEISFGYFSNHDTESWHFDLCDKCIEEIVKSFKIPPVVTNYL